MSPKHLAARRAPDEPEATVRTNLEARYGNRMGFVRHEADSLALCQAETPPHELIILIRTRTPWKSAAFPGLLLG